MVKSNTELRCLNLFPQFLLFRPVSKTVFLTGPQLTGPAWSLRKVRQEGMNDVICHITIEWSLIKTFNKRPVFSQQWNLSWMRKKTD